MHHVVHEQHLFFPFFFPFFFLNSYSSRVSDGNHADNGTIIKTGMEIESKYLLEADCVVLSEYI